MSIEKDLLIRAKVLIECLDTKPLQDQADIILSEIKDLLAQPEQEQEPVAWMYEWVNEIGEPVKSIVYNFYEDSNLIPLYTAPQKREPLSDEKLEIMYSKHAFAMDKQEYMWGFRDAEKAHGIGGGE